MSLSTLRETFDYNRWANDRLFDACGALSNEQLDRSFDIGRGSLRETLKHMYGAERVWYERIEAPGFERFPHSTPLHQLDDVRAAASGLSDARAAWLATLKPDDLERTVHYRDSRGEPHENRLADILLHICNHGIHHRAQAMVMLRGVGRPMQNNDYIFMRHERPTVRLPDAATIEKLAAGGIRIGQTIHSPATFDVMMLRGYFKYDEWANGRLLDAAMALDDERLDRPFEFGLKTLRRTLLHIRDAGQNWLDNWLHGSTPGWVRLPVTTSIAELRELHRLTAEARREFLAKLDDAALACEILAQPAEGMRLYFRLGEAMLQVCCHGTHHRAQALNMLRRLGAETPPLDYVVMARQR